MTAQEIYNIVQELNYELWDKSEHEKAFSFTSNGSVEIVSFEEIVLWHSEDDEREFNEKEKAYEPLKIHLKKQFNKLVERMEVISFDDKDVQKKTIIIQMAEHLELKKAAEKFYALQENGVDNWSGWGDSMESYEKHWKS